MITFRITIPANLGMDASAWRRVMTRFEHEAGQRVVDAIQNLLGTDSLYSLKDGYADKKQAGRTRPRMKSVGGKPGGVSWGQPLILTGEMYEALGFRREGNEVVIEVDPSKGMDKRGDDYAEMWEERTEYLEKGLDAVEDTLPDLLLDIIFEEMRL